VSATGGNLDLAGTAVGGRKLIAIAYCDMVGYSRLIGRDDAGTLRRLRTLRRALIDPAIREFGGRVVQTGGDSLLVAFDSIDGAVRCAVKVQQQVPVYDGDQSPDRRIRFRIGINIGDVIADGTDLHGDSTNIAARLEAASPVGGICVSRAVRDHVHGRLDLQFEPIGELTLKNIARPVEAFVLRLDPGAKEPEVKPVPAVPIVSGAAPSRQQGNLVWLRSVWAACAVMLTLCIAGGTAWWLTRGPVGVATEPSRVPITGTGVGLSNAPRLSLVVLPFDNLGTDRADNSTADGITEDLTTLVAQSPDFSVIARNSAFAYRGQPIDIKRVGDELRARYAAEGSVRRVEGTLRVSVQLVSTETGTHLWADHFDVGRDGRSNNVDDVVQQISLALVSQIIDAEAARGARERPLNPDGFDLMLQARALQQRPHSLDLEKQILALYEGAVRLDPSLATALAGLAEALLDTNSSVAEDPAVPARFRRAEELVAKAELLQPQNQKVMWARVYLLAGEQRCDEVIPAAKRTIELYPTNSGPIYRTGLCLLRAGRAAEAIPVFEQAIRMNPRNGQNFSRYYNLGYALLFLGRYDEAVPWFQRSLAANPSNNGWERGFLLAGLAAARALGGHTKEAHTHADEVIRLWPTLTARSYYQFKLTSPVAVAQVSRMRDGLRQAGIRDHAGEDADFHLPSDKVLHSNYEAHTPTAVPDARTIGTHDLAIMLEQRKPLVIDAGIPWGESVPGAIGLWGVGVGGSITADEYQGRLGSKMQELTHGDQKMPVVAMGWNAERYQGRNLALRLVALGYTNVYWYRGGREAWEVAGLPETELVMQDW
jgi:TolB-like protein/class 3 adenylate cyclase